MTRRRFHEAHKAERIESCVKERGTLLERALIQLLLGCAYKTESVRNRNSLCASNETFNELPNRDASRVFERIAQKQLWAKEWTHVSQQKEDTADFTDDGDVMERSESFQSQDKETNEHPTSEEATSFPKRFPSQMTCHIPPHPPVS